MSNHSDSKSDQPLLDLGVVGSLHQLGQRRGRDLLGQLIGLFADQGPKSIAILRRAVAEKDVGQIRETAHSLKGSYRSLGTSRLAEISAELESLGRESRLDGVEQLIDRLEGNFALTLEALEAYVKDQSS